MIFGDRYFYCRIFVKRDDSLNRPFAKRLDADQFAGAGILDCSGNDFRSACATTVDQYDQRQRCFFQIGLRSFPLAVLADDRHDRSLRDQQAGDLDAFTDQSARIVAQIQDQRGHALLGQFAHLLREVVAGGFAEHRQPDIADAVFQYFSTDRLEYDGGACQAVFFGFLAGALNSQRDFAAFLAANLADRFVERHVLGVLPVDFDNQVAAENSGSFGRRSFDRGYDG